MISCGPNYIGDLGVLCEGWLRPPALVRLPLDPQNTDLQIDIRESRGFKPLAIRGSGPGWETLKRDGLVALVTFEPGGPVVRLRRKRPDAPRAAYLQAVGPSATMQ